MDLSQHLSKTTGHGYGPLSYFQLLLGFGIGIGRNMAVQPDSLGQKEDNKD
jgi:hypothetical protein